MADFDTAAKRVSGMGLCASDPPLLPIPDGTLDVSDRMHFLDLYSGIAAGGGGGAADDYTQRHHHFYSG